MGRHASGERFKWAWIRHQSRYQGVENIINGASLGLELDISNVDEYISLQCLN